MEIVTISQVLKPNGPLFNQLNPAHYKMYNSLIFYTPQNPKAFLLTSANKAFGSHTNISSVVASH
ncbi:hypothetical protein H5410_033564 [Solanum commersonii]|uniref:Uncharacterized protein n=1 Tax=Solanum commersonii TaxID=4109 RepID=A0A9J5YNZ9_SOLCO|nr:hypothetical protein H5410_033564 [Solanum commersonii]